MPATPIGLRNKIIEDQYNRHRGIKLPSFKTDDSVYVPVFSGNHRSWLSGVVQQRTGNFMQAVKQNLDKTWIFFRVTSETIPHRDCHKLLLDILLDTFSLPQQPNGSSDRESESTFQRRLSRQTHAPILRVIIQPRRETCEWIPQSRENITETVAQTLNNLFYYFLVPWCHSLFWPYGERSTLFGTVLGLVIS